MTPFVAFVVDGLSVALPLNCVLRAVRAVATLPLPQAPAIVCGIINLQGCIVPVVSLRRRFGFRERELALGDKFLVVRSARRTLVMIVDAVSGVVVCEEKDFVPIDAVVDGTDQLEGVVKSPAGMLLIQDIDRFLSLAEEQALDAALAPLA